jgi:ATP-dependent DNA helicase RecQ
MKVRSDIARKFSQPPEIICNDSLLRLIAEKKPETQTELLNLEGMNNRIFNKIGESIIEEIKEFLKKEDLSDNNRTDIKQNLATIKKLVTKGYSLDEISGLLKLSDHLVSLQVESLLTYEPHTDINKLIPKREIDIISEKIDEGITDLKLLKSELNDITYAKLRIVLTKKKLS